MKMTEKVPLNTGSWEYEVALQYSDMPMTPRLSLMQY
jgi:hypothetical protein